MYLNVPYIYTKNVPGGIGYTCTEDFLYICSSKHQRCGKNIYTASMVVPDTANDPEVLMFQTTQMFRKVYKYIMDVSKLRVYWHLTLLQGNGISEIT